MSDNATLINRIRNISRYEGITEGQASVLRAGANALEQADRELDEQAKTIKEVERLAELDLKCPCCTGYRSILEAITSTDAPEGGAE